MPDDKKQGRVCQPKITNRSGRRKRRKGMCLEDRPCLEPNAAGIDIGAREIFVAVPPDRDEHPVRVFETFTPVQRGRPGSVQPLAKRSPLYLLVELVPG